MKWRRNNAYNWFIFILLGSLSLTVLVISVTAASPSAHLKISLIFISSSSLYSANISLSVVIVFESMSCVVLTYCMKRFHHSFASCMVRFSNIGSVIFWWVFVLPFLSPDSSLEEPLLVGSDRLIFSLVFVILTAPCCNSQVTIRIRNVNTEF